MALKLNLGIEEDGDFLNIEHLTGIFPLIIEWDLLLRNKIKTKCRDGKKNGKFHRNIHCWPVTEFIEYLNIKINHSRSMNHLILILFIECLKLKIAQ